MKKLLFLVLFVATAMMGQAQVSKMLGQWNTFDDKTGDMRSTVNIYEENGTYQCVITTLYEKDANGKFQVMKAPYPKGFEGVVGTQLFSEMKVDGDQLKGRVYDPESPYLCRRFEGLEFCFHGMKARRETIKVPQSRVR